MSDPRRPPLAPPTGTVVLDDGGGADLRDAVRWVRTLLAAVLGAAAALGLASAVVVALSVQHVLDDEHPWAWASVLLGVPQARAELAGEVLADLEEQAGRPFAAAERAELSRALDAVLGSPDVRRELADLAVVDGRLDGEPVIDAAVDELEAQATRASPASREVLEQYAATIRDATDRQGTVADIEGDAGGPGDLRGFGLVVAALLLVPAAVCAALAVAIARRRALTAVLAAAGGLLLAATLLSPGRFVLDHLGGPLELPGAVLAALGALVGVGWVWTLVLLALVPPGLWWVARSVRGTRNADEGAGPHWVP